MRPEAQPEPSKEAMSDSSLEREESQMQPKKMEVNKSIGPSTEDGDAYCVDDDEEDEDDESGDDELEREQ